MTNKLKRTNKTVASEASVFGLIHSFSLTDNYILELDSFHVCNTMFQISHFLFSTTYKYFKFKLLIKLQNRKYFGINLDVDPTKSSKSSMKKPRNPQEQVCIDLAKGPM